MPARHSWLNVCTVVCLLAVGLLNFGPWLGVGDNANTFISLLSGVVFTVLHGGMTLGWKRITVFLAIVVAVSFTAEAVGVATGWVFGHYYYTDQLGPKILGVPPLIQAGYSSMGYASMMTARVILGAFGTPRGWRVAGVAVGAAFLMVSWDVAMDPYQATTFGDWIWQDGGPYFGIPIHNYVGWFGTVLAYLLLYLLYERTNPLPEAEDQPVNRGLWAQPVIYYALYAMGLFVIPWVGGLPDKVASPQNYTGSLDSLMWSMTLVVTFVMGTPVVLALVRLFGREK